LGLEEFDEICSCGRETAVREAPEQSDSHRERRRFSFEMRKPLRFAERESVARLEQLTIKLMHVEPNVPRSPALLVENFRHRFVPELVQCLELCQFN